MRDDIRITLKPGHSTFEDYDNKTRWDEVASQITADPQNMIVSSTDQVPGILELEEVSKQEMSANPIPNQSVAIRKELLELGVDWVPYSRIFQISIDGFSDSSADQNSNVSDYVPGALVVFDNHQHRKRWRAFYVLWNQQTTAGGMVMYVLPGEKKRGITRHSSKSITGSQIIHWQTILLSGDTGRNSGLYE